MCSPRKRSRKRTQWCGTSLIKVKKQEKKAKEKAKKEKAKGTAKEKEEAATAP